MPGALVHVTALYTHTMRDLLKPLRTSNKHSNLQLSPSDLTYSSVFIVIVLFICRKIKHLTGLGTSFVPIVPASDDGAPGDRASLFRLPDSSLEMPLKFDSSHKSLFIDAVSEGTVDHVSAGFVVNDALVAIYLGALSEAAMLLLLCKRDCPVSPLGAVKVRNRFELIRPELCRSLLVHNHRMIATTPTAAEDGNRAMSQVQLYARYPRPARKVKKGIETDIEVTIVSRHQSHNPAGSTETPVYRQEMTILQFRRWEHESKPSESRSSMQFVPDPTSNPSPSNHDPYKNMSFPQDSMNDAEPLYTTHLSVDSPRLWARICKDYNPIHVLPWAARLFGLSSVIAHGNHAVAASFWVMANAVRTDSSPTGQPASNLSAAERTKEFVRQRLQGQGSKETEGWWMEVKFRGMLFLPAKFGPTVVTNGGTRFHIVTSKSSKTVVEVEVGDFPT